MTPVKLDSRQRAELEYLVSHTPLAKERCRAQTLLWLDEGEAVEPIAEALHVSRQTVYNWVNRFRGRPELDLRGRLADAPIRAAPEPGRTASIPGSPRSSTRTLGTSATTRRSGPPPCCGNICGIIVTSR